MIIRNGFVSYSVLGGILAAAGTLYVFLATQHQGAGHPRHDQQIVDLDHKVSNQIELHEKYYESRFKRVEKAMIRMEMKQDHIIDITGTRYPIGAPPVRDIYPGDLPGGTPDGGQ